MKKAENEESNETDEKNVKAFNNWSAEDIFELHKKKVDKGAKLTDYFLQYYQKRVYQKENLIFVNMTHIIKSFQ